MRLGSEPRSRPLWLRWSIAPLLVLPIPQCPAAAAQLRVAAAGLGAVLLGFGIGESASTAVIGAAVIAGCCISTLT